MELRLDHLLDAWVEATIMFPAWRRGQAFFNTVDSYDRATAEALRLSDANPFYDDSKVPDAIRFVADRWEN